MKKYLILALIGLASMSADAFATGSEGGSSGYNKPIVTDAFGFSAVYSNGNVVMKWTPAIKEDAESFKYFKVVASHNNPNPVYPEDGYLTYSSDKSFSTYTDAAAKSGANWYRICAIYEKNRICSPVTKVLIPGRVFEDKNESDKASKEWKDRVVSGSGVVVKPRVNPDFIRLDDVTKTKLDGLIGTFKTNLEAKFSTDSERIAYIDAVIKKASALTNVGPKLRLSLKYIIVKLGDLKNSYSNDDDTIEGVLKVE